MLRLRLLGSFELRGPGDRPLKITARKTRALLAFLALQNGTRQSRERLAALLWEDADAELARSSLRQALTALRRALPAKLHTLLEADPQQVALNLAQVQVDVGPVHGTGQPAGELGHVVRVDDADEPVAGVPRTARDAEPGRRFELSLTPPGRPGLTPLHHYSLALP